MTHQSKEFKSSRITSDSRDPLKVQFLAEYRIKIEQLSEKRANLNRISTTKAESTDQTALLQRKIEQLETTLAQYEQLILKSW